MQRNLSENLSPRRAKLAGDICNPEMDQVTFKQFNKLFENWSAEAKRRYFADVVRVCSKVSVI